MHLLDKVVQARQDIIVSRLDGAQVWRFPGVQLLAGEVARCALRYVLRDDVTSLCTELAFEDDTILGTSIELLRVPAPKLWIEFAGSARQKVFSDLGRLDEKADSSSRQRIGLLVTSDERGRKGTIDVCWENGSDLSPDVAPFAIEYDFDDDSLSQVGRIVPADPRIGVNIGDHDGLNALYKHMRFTLRAQWHRYYAHIASGDAQYREFLLKAVDPLLEDIPFFAMFCLLLMSKSAMNQHPSDRSRLNNARERRGRLPLLDHIEMSMNLPTPSSDVRESIGHRTSPRLHFVRGHLVRRGDSIFWRTSHMRGKPELGSIRTRTISLHIAAGSNA